MGVPGIETGSRGERADLWGRFGTLRGRGRDHRASGRAAEASSRSRSLGASDVPATAGQPPSSLPAPSVGVPLPFYTRSNQSPGGLRSLPAAHCHLPASQPGSALWGLLPPPPFPLIIQSCAAQPVAAPEPRSCPSLAQGHSVTFRPSRARAAPVLGRARRCGTGPASSPSPPHT